MTSQTESPSDTMRTPEVRLSKRLGWKFSFLTVSSSHSAGMLNATVNIQGQFQHHQSFNTTAKKSRMFHSKNGLAFWNRWFKKRLLLKLKTRMTRMKKLVRFGVQPSWQVPLPSLKCRSVAKYRSTAAARLRQSLPVMAMCRTGMRQGSSNGWISFKTSKVQNLT